MLEPGAVILGKYRVEHVLGKGGMGVVARAHHLDLDQPVAIKLLLPAALENQSMVQRFRREARAMVQLKSEHVSKVLDIGTLENGAPYMVMEYLEGKDLGQCLREQGRLEPGFAVDLILQACEALAEAHAAGIVHRDIKPANFFLTRGPDGAPLLKVLDFGIAKALHAVNEDFTTSQALMGTPSYMSPEQMHSSKYVDARTDIWAIGVVLYELVSGRRPFRADSYAGLCLAVTTAPVRPLDDVDVSAGLAEIITRCLQKEPSLRFGDIAELAAALAPHAGTAAQASRSSERAMRILALAGTSGRAVEGRATPLEMPTVSQRKRRNTPGEQPSGHAETLSTTSPSSASVTTFEIASKGAMTHADASAAPSVETAGRGTRYALIASIAAGAGLALALLLIAGGTEPSSSGNGAGDPASQSVAEPVMGAARPAAGSAVAPGVAPGPDSEARAATAPAPVPPPPDAGVEATAPSTPPVAQPVGTAEPTAADPSPPASGTPRRTRRPASTGKGGDTRPNQKPDKPSDDDFSDDFD
jgi:serine/threonine protein kinase